MATKKQPAMKITPPFGYGGIVPLKKTDSVLLQEYETDLDTTAQMCAMVNELELFSPFTFQIVQDDAPSLKLQGMHRIDEQKLKALKPASHKALVSKGVMGKIYAHIHSLENFARLYTRAVARARAPAKPMRR